VLVYRRVETARIIFKYGIPITYYEFRDVIREKTYTDADGYVYFPEKRLYLNLSEKITKEYIDINLNRRGAETVDQYFSNVDKGLYNPIKYLKGAILESAKIELTPEEHLSPPEYRKEEFNHILNSKSLLKKRDELVVKLERW